MLDIQSLRDLEQKYGSSFYLLNVTKLRENYQKIFQAFHSRYENFIIGYSYKTNYLPYLCKELSKMGAFAEVVSRLEYDLAIKIGEDPKRIIFNGPLKTREDVHLALKNESLINIDSFYEIDFIREYAADNPRQLIKVGMRLNFDITHNGESPHQDGYEVGRFGICVENGNFHKAIHELKAIDNVEVIGLHGHFSTSKREVESYQKITRKLCSLAKEYLRSTIEYIDVGGGIYGELPESFNLNTPTFDHYAEAICGIMDEEFPTQDSKPILILEPGISMVANVFTFVSKVIEVKTVRDVYFVLVDGSVHNIKPTMHKNNLPMKMIRQKESAKERGAFHIVGYTCMEKDYLAYEIMGELPDPGDYIIFENVGAYTIVFNPPFIKERPGILAVHDHEVIEVRKQETIKQFFNEEIYRF
ncbi:diaminopimelate decarboxylase [Mesobacillus campisalis]|uniref:Diaminopimelate decarboxylase n=2 Tax=Mesobacillus campisalis TaxID=1408103 RepID=A0A0M2SQ10_9BACI|nr:diaminopimelate decarboxylase [Mesobacillus campisalis]KKK36634.1 diaminopimelate decarboxylase [Mesobacillus campisalis]